MFEKSPGFAANEQQSRAFFLLEGVEYLNLKYPQTSYSDPIAETTFVRDASLAGHHDAASATMPMIGTLETTSSAGR